MGTLRAWPTFVLRWSLLIGVAAGAGAGGTFAALRAASGESLAPAVVVGVVAALLMAPTFAVVANDQMWRGFADLSFGDRRRVARAVRRGTPVDPRLAPAVIGLAAHTRRMLERTRRNADRRWLRWAACALVIAGFAMAALAGASPASLALQGACVAFVLGVALYLPQRRRTVARNADRAARAAGAAAGAAPTDPRPEAP